MVAKEPMATLAQGSDCRSRKYIVFFRYDFIVSYAVDTLHISPPL